MCSIISSLCFIIYSAHSDFQSLTEESKCLLESRENCSILSEDLINSINTE